MTHAPRSGVSCAPWVRVRLSTHSRSSRSESLRSSCIGVPFRVGAAGSGHEEGTGPTPRQKRGGGGGGRRRAHAPSRNRHRLPPRTRFSGFLGGIPPNVPGVGRRERSTDGKGIAGAGRVVLRSLGLLGGSQGKWELVCDSRGDRQSDEHRTDQEESGGGVPAVNEPVRAVRPHVRGRRTHQHGTDGGEGEEPDENHAADSLSRKAVRSRSVNLYCLPTR